MSRLPISRRDLLRGAGAFAGLGALGALAPEPMFAAPRRPSSPVSISRCGSYELPVQLRELATLFDRVGGLKKAAAGKTVLVKVNMTGSPKDTIDGLPAYRTYQVHPNMVLALATLLDRAGAKRIRFVEGTYQNGPIEEFFRSGGWDIAALQALKTKVEFEDTKGIGQGKQYHRVRVPWGGSLFPAYDLNHSYVDCDSYVSLAKLKNHYCAGVTLSMKNNFGVTPPALYGQHEHNERTTNARVHIIHEGAAQPAAGAPAELDPSSPRRPTYRVPRHVVDANGIRPIDLAIIDGIETNSGGEGPWIKGVKALQPHLLFAGRNAVCTDAVATAVMGYDPMAKPATGPFPGDNHLAMAAALGLGANDPREIEVAGLSIKEALYPFKWEPEGRNY